MLCDTSNGTACFTHYCSKCIQHCFPKYYDGCTVTCWFGVLRYWTQVNDGSSFLSGAIFVGLAAYGELRKSLHANVTSHQFFYFRHLLKWFRELLDFSKHPHRILCCSTYASYCLCSVCFVYHMWSAVWTEGPGHIAIT